MKKQLICLFLVICLTLSPLTVNASAASSRDFTREEALASSLKALGLFRGQCDTGLDFALDRAPTRAEALVMLLRLLGLEKAALTEQNSHPFTDTAAYSWATPYIAYAYTHGLTKGEIEGKIFGGNHIADAATYLTFVLRALGYTEGEGGDFIWDKPYALARKCGILPGYVQSLNFMRADVVSISYAALGAQCKNGSGTLAQTLLNKDVLTETALSDYYDPQAAAQGQLNDTVSKNVAAFSADFSNCRDAT